MDNTRPLFVSIYPPEEAAGGAVVSTPYLYAEEVLAQGRGQLVPFADSAAMAGATLRYLHEPAFERETRRRAYNYARPMFWPNIGRQYLKLFDQVGLGADKLRKSNYSEASPVHSGKVLESLPGGV